MFVLVDTVAMLWFGCCILLKTTTYYSIIVSLNLEFQFTIMTYILINADYQGETLN